MSELTFETGDGKTHEVKHPDMVYLEHLNKVLHENAPPTYRHRVTTSNIRSFETAIRPFLNKPGLLENCAVRHHPHVGIIDRKSGNSHFTS